MTDRTLTAALNQHPLGIAVLTVTGELDHHTAPELTQAIQETPFDGPGAPVVIDLTELTYCDSTGIAVLVSAHNRAQKTNTSLVFAGLNDHLMRLLRIVGLDQLFTFQPTVGNAITALQTRTEL